jgi:glycerol-3-phosphate dehydrogenase (NAD(P)+)
MAMTSNNIYKMTVGVVGAGSFGCAVANILAENVQVLLYARSPQVVDQIREEHKARDIVLHENVKGTGDLELMATTCRVIFPVVPSASFRNMISSLSPFLKPDHILIHGTKGFEVQLNGDSLDQMKTLQRSQVFTMSELIRHESSVVRVGCLAGPNLAKEINEHQPAATVVASHFDEVIKLGQKLLKSDRFGVFGNNDQYCPSWISFCP